MCRESSAGGQNDKCGMFCTCLKLGCQCILAEMQGVEDPRKKISSFVTHFRHSSKVKEECHMRLQMKKKELIKDVANQMELPVACPSSSLVSKRL